LLRHGSTQPIDFTKSQIRENRIFRKNGVHGGYTQAGSLCHTGGAPSEEGSVSRWTVSVRSSNESRALSNSSTNTSSRSIGSWRQTAAGFFEGLLNQERPVADLASRIQARDCFGGYWQLVFHCWYCGN
jgi:hypothetical protein